MKVLAALEDNPGGARDRAAVLAAFGLANKGDLPAARRVLNEVRNVDDVTRDQVISVCTTLRDFGRAEALVAEAETRPNAGQRLRQDVANAAADAGSFEAAERLLARIDDRKERAAVLARVAVARIAAGDPGAAKSEQQALDAIRRNDELERFPAHPNLLADIAAAHLLRGEYPLLNALLDRQRGLPPGELEGFRRRVHARFKQLNAPRQTSGWAETLADPVERATVLVLAAEQAAGS
jgi:hypothetical protein